MATIKGKWKWNEVIDLTGHSIILYQFDCNFESNGEQYLGFVFYSLYMGYTTQESYIMASENGDTGTMTCPMKEEYRLIDFGQNEQEIDDNLYNFIIANAELVPQTIAEKLQAIAENEQKVYDAGYKKGKMEEIVTTEAYEQGVVDGKQSEYDAFWDRFQSNGTRVYYDNVFAEAGNGSPCWVYGETYKPKYPIKPKTAMQMYEITRLPYEAIAEVDFSGCTDFYNTFAYSTTKHFPSIDMRVATRTNSMFGWGRVEIIDELKVSESTPFLTCFRSCTNLKEIRFSGTIGQNGLNFVSCTQLSRASIVNIIGCLSTTATGKSLTLSKASVDKAFETVEGANDGTTSQDWIDLVGTADSPKLNWTITLS